MKRLPVAERPGAAVWDVMGISMVDATVGQAVQLLLDLIERSDGTCRSVYFVNAHSLNVASEDLEYQVALRRADVVFGDGTGVRWAVRVLHGVRLRDNVNGTDLVPALFQAGARRGYSYYLLGATERMVMRAAKASRRLFPGWQLAGYHHGYLDAQSSAQVIDRINQAGPELLLVGMGNPLQEKWIHSALPKLKVPVVLGVGGLFAYWSGDLARAPLWLRTLGHEWVHLLISQPRKFRRYVVGNPLFLARVLREATRSAERPSLARPSVERPSLEHSLAEHSFVKRMRDNS